MITDNVDADLLVYVSGVPSDTRTTLSDFLHPKDAGIIDVPEEYLMRIEHKKFGSGYVLSVEGDEMTCLFGKQRKTLMCSLVADTGIVKVIEDKR